MLRGTIRRMLSRARQRAFVAGESGASTAFALSLILGGFTLGGLALDLAYAYKSREELQIAADAAAHAALYNRQTNSADAAKTMAVAVANGTLPVSSYGNVLTPADIRFGSWDFASQTFTPDPNATDAVWVSTKRFGANGNSVRTFLLNFVGVSDLDVRADAVFVTHYPTCLSQGFAAADRVDMQSNNNFYSGFCVHSNELVSMKQNNTFDVGVIISMPDSKDVEAGSGNDGVKEALRDHSYTLRILDRLDEIWNGLITGTAFVPSYITNATPISLNADLIAGVLGNDPNTNPAPTTSFATTSAYTIDSTVDTTYTDGSEDSATLATGGIYLVSCDDGSLTIGAGVLVKDVVILTTCAIKFQAGSAVENALVMTRSTSTNSVTATSGFRLGLNDNCAPGGGAQIITYGGFRVPASFEIYGGQVIARGDIQFAAQTGAQGASFISGGTIDGTSQSDFLFCKTGMELNFEMPYFRLGG
ncbi:MAG: pilus assembly protein TadG-related protein [Rhodobacter sp.]|nr:pilus assembly protein TadG-related protein [Rhodobacter sp.]